MYVNLMRQVFGQKFDCDFVKYIAQLERDNVDLFFGKGAELDPCPWLRHVPFSPSKKLFERLKSYRNSVNLWIGEKLKRHKENFADGNLTCVVDHLLHLQQNQETKRCEITDQNIINVIQDLIIGGW